MTTIENTVVFEYMHRAKTLYKCCSTLLKGNGHERDFMEDRRVFIMDMYNRYIYPRDGYAKRELHNVSTINFV